MFLKSVELFGFKSFADRTRFDFSEGVTSLLGPNGSGKSNVVDSIKWVLGSQSLNAVRASKREDVIFNGTDTRKSMPMCEVILTLSNEENILNIEAAEVEIKRRMYRSGENEYYINRQRALLRDVKDLFMDTGVGKTAYSILEQGKIDQILSLKPEDRRYIFEEAAGISRYKLESENATKKLEKTQINMEQAELLFREEEKKYNSRKIQMERLEKSRELSRRREEIEVSLQLSYVQSLRKFRDSKQEELETKIRDLSDLERLLSSRRSEMDSFENEISILRDQREGLTNRLNRADEQHHALDREIELLTERFHEIHERTNLARFRAQQVLDRLEKDRQNVDEKKTLLQNMRDSLLSIAQKIAGNSDQIDSLKSSRDNYQNEVVTNQARLEEISSQRQQTTQEISQLANEIADRLENEIKGSGYSSTLRSKAEKAFFNELSLSRKLFSEKLDLLRNLSDLENTEDLKKALDEADELFMNHLDEILGLFQEYSGTIPTFLDDFVSPTGTLARKSELDRQISASYLLETQLRDNTSQLELEIQRISNLILLKESDNQELRLEEVSLRSKAEALNSQVVELTSVLSHAQSDYDEARTNIELEIIKETDATNKIDEAKDRQKELEMLMRGLKTELDDINRTIDEKTGAFNERSSAFKAQFDRKQELTTEIATYRVNIQNLDESIQKIHTDFFEKTGKSLREFDDHEVTEAVDELKNEAEEIRQKLQSLGYINYMAEEEFNEAKANYDFYKKNLDDLKASKEDLEQVIAAIREKSEMLFMETYEGISQAFEQMFSILFGGGHAQLSLTEPDDVLHSGIEITAQPPGKKPSTLTLLSGGEKSMTAVALLFATYKVKPSPFCILDEIDAALDAKNIGSFMRVLETFGEKSQFIIITHNKGTVMGSSSLLGVTQEELGVSKMIGIRIDDEKTDERSRTLKG